MEFSQEEGTSGSITIGHRNFTFADNSTGGPVTQTILLSSKDFSLYRHHTPYVSIHDLHQMQGMWTMDVEAFKINLGDRIVSLK